MKGLQNKGSSDSFEDEELKEHLDFSGEKISAHIFEDLQSIGKIDDTKLMKFNKLKAEKGNSYAMEYMKKVAKEVKIWLNNHGFPYQERQDIVKSLEGRNKLSDILGTEIYAELKNYVFDLFEKFINQGDVTATEQGDFVSKHNEQHKQQEKFRSFITKHMNTFEKLGNSAFTTVMVLSNHDVMSKTDLLNALLDGNNDKSGKDRAKAEKVISKMIESGIIREEGEDLSLNYEGEANVLPIVQKDKLSTSLDKKEKQSVSKKNTNSKETLIVMTLKQRETDITKKIVELKIKELNSQLDDKEKVPENSVSFKSMVLFDKVKEISVSKNHPLMPILEYANTLLQKHNNNHEGGVDLGYIRMGGKELELPMESALAKIFYPIYSGNGKIAKSLPHEVREIMICLHEAAKRYDINRRDNDKFSAAAFNLICGFGDSHSSNRKENNLADVLKRFMSDLT